MSDYVDGEFQEVGPGSPDDEFGDFPRLGGLLRHYRQRAGLSQQELANESRVEASNISMIERGETRNPWPRTIEQLATALSRHILSSSAREIADRLSEAKNLKPSEYYGVDPEAVMLSDRLSTHTPKARRAIYEALSRVVDVFDTISKAK